MKILFTILVCIVIAPAYGQVYGCKDPMATNYNAAATVNDGSCTYSQTSYTPPVKVDTLNSILIESSGLQWAEGSLWSFNDAGGEAAVYRIDTASKAILQTVRLQNATNVDWEDIAYDGTYLYIGDFGNNLTGGRTDLKIYKFPLSVIPAYAANPVFEIPAGQVEVISFKYRDQPQPPKDTALNSTKYDCEAMIVDSGKIHLFSKNWINNNTTHYTIDTLTAGSYTAVPLETLATGYLVTAADKAPGKEVAALLGYQVTGVGNHFMYLLSDYSGGSYFNGNKRKINLPDASIMGQAEGLTFRNGTYGYISNEKLTRSLGPITITISPRLRFFDINNFIPQYILPVNLTNVKAYFKDQGIQVEWIAKTQTGVNRYEVEKSTSGFKFSKVADVPAKAYYATNQSYSWFDSNTNSGNNFYRIRVIEKSGEAKYSEVVKVTVGEGKSSIIVFPNPVKGNVIRLQLLNTLKGSYSVAIYNNIGQKVYAGTIKHNGGSAIFTITTSKVAKGNYTLQINKGNGVINQKFVVE